VNPGIPPSEFRQVVGHFAAGVTVVAATAGGEIHGMTANAFTSVSLDPLLVLVCVHKKARMAEFVREAGGFSINILRDEQEALSTYFAGRWPAPAPPPFRFVPWQGGPRLEGCAAAIGCELHDILDGGDHCIPVGRVAAVHLGVEPRQPLVFYAGRYARLDRDERHAAPPLDLVETPVQAYYDPWEGEER
jgi:flavin reductase (DIM6/NTAB) family NADH-FMN oxidoreductase RutF